MKKLVLSALAMGAFLSASAQTEAGTYVVDKFNSTTEIANEDGEGVFWYIGDGGDKFYSIERADTGMVVSLTDACYDASTTKLNADDEVEDAGDYFGFGFSFGDSNGEDEGGLKNWVNLGSNADVTLEVSNYSDADILMTLQLQDTEGGLADILPADRTTISTDWSDSPLVRWEKTAVSLGMNETIKITVKLSDIDTLVGGYYGDPAYPCSSPYDCPSTEYTFDPSKFAGIFFTVNGGASEDGSGLDDAKYMAATGDLVFKLLTVGDTTTGTMAGASSDVVDGDDDNDGVANSIDDCPNTVADAEVDEKGCATAGTGIEELKASIGLSVSPNPATSNVVVSFNGAANVSLVTESGVVVASTSAVGSASFDVSGLAAGVYYAKVVTAEVSVAEAIIVE